MDDNVGTWQECLSRTKEKQNEIISMVAKTEKASPEKV